MFAAIHHKGLLIGDSTVPGESKGDDVFPGQSNAIQVSKNRWLLAYATRGFKFIDNDLSILFQLRADRPDGPVIREGVLSKTVNDWDPLGDGSALSKEHGHPVAFGVPKGALINGREAVNANCFAIKWRVVGIRNASIEEHMSGKFDKGRTGQGVEWMQVRLNEAEDDIEIIQPPAALRQTGCEEGDVFCRFNGGGTVRFMNQTFVSAVPFNQDATEWADINHFDDRRIAALKHRFNPALGRYEWVETGPLMGGEPRGIFETSLLRCGLDWIIAARKAFTVSEDGAVWMRTRDLFGDKPEYVLPPAPLSYSPISAYTCADGVIRLFTGDPAISVKPQGGRNPIRCWDIDPTTFEATNQRVIFDTFAAGLPMREACGPVVDMGRLVPHAGGRVQYFFHRVRPKAINYPCNTKATVNAEEKASAGIYYAELHYEQDYPGVWQF